MSETYRLHFVLPPYDPTGKSCFEHMAYARMIGPEACRTDEDLYRLEWIHYDTQRVLRAVLRHARAVGALSRRRKRQAASRESGGARMAYVYRLYDCSGKLLYVGKTVSVATRLYWGSKSHSATKPWWTDVALVTVTTYRSEEDALEAEAWAMRSEDPTYNIVKPQPRTASSPTAVLEITGPPRGVYISDAA